MAETVNISASMNAVREMQEQMGGRKQIAEDLGRVSVDLISPLEWTGNTYTELDMDFSALKGRDIITINDELAAQGQKADNPGGNLRYQILFCARAAGVPSDVIENLSAADFNAVTNAARLFLLATG